MMEVSPCRYASFHLSYYHDDAHDIVHQTAAALIHIQ